MIAGQEKGGRVSFRSLRLLQVAVEPGPATPMLERLALALAAPRLRGRVEQRLVLKRGHPSGERLRLGGVLVAELPFRRLMDFRTGPALAEIAAIAHPDAVLFWDRAALERWPRDGLTAYGLLSDYGGLFGWRRAARLLALSDDLARAAVEQGWPEGLVEPVPLFVADELAPPLPRAVLGLPLRGDLLLATPLAPGDPGAALLIEAVAPLAHVWLCLPAAAADHRRLRALLAKAGMAERVRLLLPEQAGPALYAAADLVVAAGQWDALGLGVLPAWVAGKPVVGAGGFGPAALIRHGDNGLLCQAGNAAQLGATLRQLLDDPLRFDRLAAAGRRSFETRHREARGVEAWLAALVRGLGGPKPLDLEDEPVHTDTRA